MRRIVFNILYNSGAAYFLFMINKLCGKVPILLFHRVSPNADPCWPPLSPILFENTIRLLSKHYTFYSLDHLLQSKTTLKKNACCIVFDDGYYDFKLYALPILIKYKIPVTLFVPTNNIDKSLALWTSEIDTIIRNIDKTHQGESIIIGRTKIILKLESDKNLFITSDIIKKNLLAHESKSRNVVIESLTKKFLTKEHIQHPMLSWDDIQEMKSKHPTLINIQSHTHTHTFLPSENINKVNNELEVSKHILISKNINNIDKIAYPVGGYDSKTIDIVKKHYSYAFKVGDESANKKRIKEESYKYQIPRINISDNSPYEIFCRINGMHSLLKHLCFRFLQ